MKVIVAIDGSDQSRSIARTLHAISPFDQILLLYTISLPQLAYPGTGMSVGHDFSQRAEETLRVEGTRILDDMESNLPQGIGTVHTHIELGPAAETILRVRKNHGRHSCQFRDRPTEQITKHESDRSYRWIRPVKGNCSDPTCNFPF